MVKANLESDLIQYVKDNTFKEVNSLDTNTKLFVEGIFDSMGFVLLLDFLEEKYQIFADDDELIEENFESIAAISTFILNKSAVVS